MGRVPAVNSTPYDIITGETIENPTIGRPSASQSQFASQSLRKSTSRPSLLPQPQQPASVVSHQKYQDDTHVLQARINKLVYENENLAADRNMLVLQHEKELKDTQARSDADFRKYQDAESERLKIVRQHESSLQEIRELRDRGAEEAATAEKKTRDLRGQNNALREEKEDLETRLHDVEREMRRMLMEEVEGKRSQLERTLQETTAELDEMKARFDNINFRLQQKEKDAETLENRVLELNSKVGGGDELELLKRELGEQVAYVRRLETQIREQGSEIRRLQAERKSVNLVVEEKRALQVKIESLEQVERRANELEIQKEILEDEKRIWTSLLEKEGEEGQKEFETPEAVVKALVNERIEHALLLERLGAAEAEVVGKDEALRAMESERNVLKFELENVKAAESAPIEDGPVDTQAFRRIDRQRQLAQKEVEYLRAQLETFQKEEQLRTEKVETEDPDLLDFDVNMVETTPTAESGENQDDIQDDEGIAAARAAKMAQRIRKVKLLQETVRAQRSENLQHIEQTQRLEVLLQEHRSEITKLHSEMAALQSVATAAQSLGPKTGQKRGAESQEVEDGQYGHVLRKNKNLQVALQKVTSQSQLLATELQATKSQLKALRASSSTRILELRDNPTAQHEATKASTLRTLKQENQDLMRQLRGDSVAMSQVKVIPVSSYDALKLDLKDMEMVVADKEKRMKRQREIWTQKAAEFRDVISSILGYRVTFLPNGKVKVRSMYYTAGGEEGEEEEEEDDREDYIEFDGEKGTMKIGGGTNSAFGQEIGGTVDYWVKERKEIPVFLAAMTLEFYEKFGGMAPLPPSADVE